MLIQAEYEHQKGETTTVINVTPVDNDHVRLGYTEGDLAGSNWTLTISLTDINGVLVPSTGALTNPKAVSLYSTDGNSWRAAWDGAETDELGYGTYLWKFTAVNATLSPSVTLKHTTRLKIVKC